MNDRALRAVTVGLGGASGAGSNGFVRESGFDITVASEVMACLCLAADLADLENRLARIVVAHSREGQPVTAGALHAAGAMTALLKDAIKPNLVQTLEGSPALIHGGPFANIAHGCNSVIATRTALKLADYAVTEAGFGADLGAEKFFDIKCRQAGLKPDAAVIVATVRALKFNGGVAVADLGSENLAALQQGLVNLGRHVRNVRSFGVPVIVAINHFTSDTEAEHRLLADICEAEFEVEAVQCRHWADGGAGAEQLARCVVARCESGESRGSGFAPLYDDAMPLADKIRTIATRIYGASEVAFTARASADLQGFDGRRPWRAAGLHGQDAGVVLGRPEAARRAVGPRAAGARGAACRGRRLRRRDLRRHHDHAGPAGQAGRARHPRQSRRRDRGPVLTASRQTLK